MSRYGPTLRRLATLLVVAAIIWFFWRAFSRNWDSLRSQRLDFQPAFLLLSLAGFLATGLLGTVAWHESMRALFPQRLTFRDSIAVVNVSSLVKYVPGKVWTYALQMYWLGKRDIAKSRVVYVNVINIAVSLLMTTLLGALCLVLVPERVPRALSLTLLGAVLAVDYACIRFNAPLFGWALGLLNRLLKSNIERFDVAPALMLRLHLVHFAAAVTFAIAGYAVCYGVGYGIDSGQLALFIAAFLLSDVVGFLAFMTPGGLGVREGVMYALLGGAATGPFALVVPLAARGLSMLADVVLGAYALKLLRADQRSQ